MSSSTPSGSVTGQYRTGTPISVLNGSGPGAAGGNEGPLEAIGLLGGGGYERHLDVAGVPILAPQERQPGVAHRPGLRARPFYVDGVPEDLLVEADGLLVVLVEQGQTPHPAELEAGTGRRVDHVLAPVLLVVHAIDDSPQS